MPSPRYTACLLVIALLASLVPPLGAVSTAVPLAPERPGATLEAALPASPAAAAKPTRRLNLRRHATTRARAPKEHATAGGLDVASLATAGGGILFFLLGTVTGFTFLLSLVAFPLAVVFGAIALKRIKRGAEGRRGMAIAGLVLGIVGTVVMLLLTVAIVAFFANGF